MCQASVFSENAGLSQETRTCLPLSTSVHFLEQNVCGGAVSTVGTRKPFCGLFPLNDKGHANPTGAVVLVLFVDFCLPSTRVRRFQTNTKLVVFTALGVFADVVVLVELTFWHVHFFSSK